MGTTLAYAISATLVFQRAELLFLEANCIKIDDSMILR